MARDYKYRANGSKKKPQATKVAWWKWLLIVLLICLFISFLVFLTNSTPEIPPKKQASKSTPVAKKIKQSKTPKRQDKKPENPSYVFYTMLSEEETVVPDYEIKTRTREELVGKIKASKYLIQAGSFRESSEADKLKARLTLLNYQPRIEKAKVKNTVWNRVKLGPFNRPSEVANIKKRLRQSGIDVIVTEIKK